MMSFSITRMKKMKKIKAAHLRSFYEEYDSVPLVDLVLKNTKSLWIAHVAAQASGKPVCALGNEGSAGAAEPTVENDAGADDDDDDEPSSKKRRTQAGDETAKQLCIRSDFPGKFASQFQVFKRVKATRSKLVGRGPTI